MLDIRPEISSIMCLMVLQTYCASFPDVFNSFVTVLLSSSSESDEELDELEDLDDLEDLDETEDFEETEDFSHGYVGTFE